MFVRDRWQWLGQPYQEWPSWLIFKNYATDYNTITIHQLIPGPITVRIGDWIVNSSQGDVHVEPGS